MVLTIFFNSIFIPAVAIVLMWRLEFIKSLDMQERQERIGPLIVVSISYLWLFLNIKNYYMIPIPFSRFVLGALIAIFLAFFVNNFSKISLHGVGVGGMLMGALSLFARHGKGMVNWEFGNSVLQVHNIVIIAVLLVLSGVVLSSRLYLKAHHLQDILGGVLVGIVGQLIAFILF